MNWYKMAKHIALRSTIAMPLPRANGYPFDDDMHEVNEKFKPFSQTDADDFESQNGPLNYVGHGTNGVVYDNNNDTNLVTKLTADEEEARSATLMTQNPCPCVIRVHSVSPVGTGGWKIVRERATPLNFQQQKSVALILDALIDGAETVDEAIELFEQHDPGRLKGYADSLRELFDGVKSFSSCLDSHGLKYTDILGPNLGFSPNGDIVLIDLGGLEYKNGRETDDNPHIDALDKPTRPLRNRNLAVEQTTEVPEYEAEAEPNYPKKVVPWPRVRIPFQNGTDSDSYYQGHEDLESSY
jgi:hypothetical protein